MKRDSAPRVRPANEPAGPWVRVATFCRDVELTPDDTCTIHEVFNSVVCRHIPATVNLTLVIGLGGMAAGAHVLTLVAIFQDGSDDTFRREQFEARTDGEYWHRFPVPLEVDEVGRCDVDVFMDGRWVTRVPLTIVLV